jgi:hypothetical protein
MPQIVRDRQPYLELLKLSTPAQHEGNPPITLTVLIDRRSQFYRRHGDLHHGRVWRVDWLA